MAGIDLNERAKEVSIAFQNPYGLVKTELKGEIDLFACIASVIDKITSAYAMKFEKAEHPLYPGILKDEILLVEAYIALLHMSHAQGLILENMKVVGKNRINQSAQIVDMVNTLSKIGKLNQAISDHSLASRALNQLLVYADRNDYSIENVYQIMLAKQSNVDPMRLAS